MKINYSIEQMPCEQLKRLLTESTMGDASVVEWADSLFSADSNDLLCKGGPVQLEGILSLPVSAHALVVIAYDRMGSSGHNLNDLAEVSRRAGFATLVVNLLTPEDEAFEAIPGVANVCENAQSRHQVEQLATWWFTSHLSV